MAPHPETLGHYSTTEVPTGCRWTDGRIIYRKVVDTGAPPGVLGTTNTAHGITNLGVLVDASFVAKNPATGEFVGVPSSPEALGLSFRVDGTNITVVNTTLGSFAAFSSSVCTLVYAKT